MRAGEASRTAEYMALFRALESSRGAHRLFDDPFAAAFLPASLRLVAQAAREPHQSGAQGVGEGDHLTGGGGGRCSDGHRQTRIDM